MHFVDWSKKQNYSLPWLPNNHLKYYPVIITRERHSSVCVDNNSQMRKRGEEWGRPGIIHHVSDVRWT